MANVPPTLILGGAAAMGKVLQMCLANSTFCILKCFINHL